MRYLFPVNSYNLKIGIKALAIKVLFKSFSA